VEKYHNVTVPLCVWLR